MHMHGGMEEPSPVQRNDMDKMTKSIVYGSIATPIKKPESDHTHKWTVYVKGAFNDDISVYVKKVVFRLHESFTNPTRTIESHPFEVTETGWGEFQLQIRIQFHDPNQRALNLTHHLKLYPTEDVDNLLKTTKPVISEHYEEIVFDPPSEIMRRILETSDKDAVQQKESAELSKLVHCIEKYKVDVHNMEIKMEALKTGTHV